MRPLTLPPLPPLPLLPSHFLLPRRLDNQSRPLYGVNSHLIYQPLLKHWHKHYFPERGGLIPAGQAPADPTLYRLYEIISVYGYAIKSVIHERFGDGIMSAINFSAKVDKVEKNGADNVQITLTGKWLPYDFHEAEQSAQ